MDNNELMAMLVKNQSLLTELLQEKAVGTSHTAMRLHGVGGIFNTRGLERDIITAYVRPMGIAEVLPVVPSVAEVPYFGTITGFTATTGSQPANACDDAPTGYMKGCNLTAKFGLKRFDSHTIEMDKVMLKLNRGDFTDLVLHGQLLTNMGLRPSDIDEKQALNIVTMAEMMIVGANFERALCRDIWQGTIGQGTFPGLDVQIATGHRDAETGVYCPAVDSDVKDFNYNDVDGTVLDIVEYVSMLHWYLENNATSMGLAPVQWVFAMNKNLWYELSAVWACRYMSRRCSDFSNAQLVSVNDDAAVRLRDDMRAGKYLIVNGQKIPVIVDDGIYEYNNVNDSHLQPGEFASAIYLVPLSIVGGFPVTYIEYVDYRQAQPDVNFLAGKEEFWWTDNGRYSWAVELKKWCYMLAAKTEQRVVLRTPQLAGKIQRVKYSPLQHLREPFADGAYNYDGGVSLRDKPTTYAVWGTR